MHIFIALNTVCANKEQAVKIVSKVYIYTYMYIYIYVYIYSYICINMQYLFTFRERLSVCRILSHVSFMERYGSFPCVT